MTTFGTTSIQTIHNMPDYLETNLNFYQEQFSTYQHDVRSLGYSSQRSQVVRFLQFTRLVDFNHQHIIDVGCGFGDFYTWLLQQQINPATYTGIDLSEENVRTALGQVHGSNARFIAGDFINLTSLPATDYCVLSGIFNLPFDNKPAFIEAVLNKMWNLSEKGILFNIEFDRQKSADLPLSDPEHSLYWLNYSIQHFSSFVVYLSDYHDMDLTIGVFKSKYL